MNTPLQEAARVVGTITQRQNDPAKMSADELRVCAAALMHSAAAATMYLVDRCDGDQAAADAMIQRAGRLANGVMDRHAVEFAAAVEQGETPRIRWHAAHVARMLKEISGIARLIDLHETTGPLQ